MGDAFWEFLSLLLKTNGILSLIMAAEFVLAVYLFWMLNKKEVIITGLQANLMKLSEKRLEDVKEERDDYAELARNLDKSINFLAAVYQRRNGNGNGREVL